MTVGDDRGILPSYALLYRGAELIGADADALFRSASFLAEDPMWETPAQFAGRGPNDRSIEVFGMMLVTDRAGVTFRPKG
jgi:hypothetical protein